MYSKFVSILNMLLENEWVLLSLKYIANYYIYLLLIILYIC